MRIAGWVEHWFSLALVFALLWAPSRLVAQIDNGSISGTITDPSGEVVQGATVTATEAQSGTTYTALSSSTGYYLFNSVRSGNYKLAVSSAGFQTLEAAGVTVYIGTRVSKDFKLKTGNATETVQVTAGATGLESETSSIGTVITPQQVADLPLAVGGAFRSLSTLAFLAPGAVGPGTNGGTVYAKIAGGQTEGSDFLLDGISTLRSENGSAQFDQTTPSVDAIQEFRVETASLPVYIGRTTGGVANFKTRSGTNGYHGVLYDFYKNSALDANNWFNNGNLALATTAAQRNQFQRSPDTKNDYGVTMGGPLRIPHLYDGRNKTFFFFSFEQLLYHTGGTTISTLPTDAQRNGDFSATLGGPLTGSPAPTNPCTGDPILAGQIFDPSTTRTVTSGTTTALCRTPFVNNQAPLGRSQVAQNVLALIPHANLAGTTNNYAFRYTDNTSNTAYSIRIDENINTRNHIFGFFNSRENFDHGAPNLPYPIESGTQVQDLYSKYGRGGWDFTISPHLLNEFSFGSNRINSLNTAHAALAGIDYDQQLGIPNVPSAGTTFPIFNIGESLPQIGQANFDQNVDNAIIGNDILDWQKGAHNLRIGGTVRWQQFSYTNSGPAAGTFDFGRAQTASVNTPQAEAQSGNSIASFLLGSPGSIGRTVQVHAPRWISNYYAVFVQDDWKARRNLTLNLGLRWSLDTPRHEAEGDTSSLDITEANPGANGILGALAFGGVGPGRNGNKNEAWADNYYKNIEPRVGFAWSPSFWHDRIVLRGAYSILYGPLVYADYGQGLSTGFTNNFNHFNSDGFSPNGPLDNGFPTTDVIGVNTNPSQLNGQGIDYVAKSYARPAMVQNWSLEQQYEIVPDLVFSLGYVGGHSTRLHGLLTYLNDIPEKYLALGDVLYQPYNSAAATAAGVTTPFANFPQVWGSGAQSQQALRPLPQYGYVNGDSYLQNAGQSTYNALVAKLERRFSNGLNLLASYTFSKTLTDADSIQPYYSTVLGQGGTQNPFNLKAEKAVSTQDVPNNFVVSYLYDLPVGKGKKFLANTPKPVSAVISNWRVGGIQRYISGQPISFFGEPGIPGFDNGIRPNRVPGADALSPLVRSGKFTPKSGSTYNVYWNPAAFADPNANRNGGTWMFGNMPRNSADLRSFAFYDEDLNVNKTIPIHDTISLQFRGEMFNAFNRHVFNKPDSGVNDVNFGQVSSLLLGPRNVQFVLRLNY